MGWRLTLLRQGLEAHSSVFSWQRGPLYPARQTQLKPSASSTQMPVRAHGDDAHSSTSTSHRRPMGNKPRDHSLRLFRA